MATSPAPVPSISELERHLDQGSPWPAEVCRSLASLPPAQLRRLLRSLQLRQRLRAPGAKLAFPNGLPRRLPALDSILQLKGQQRWFAPASLKVATEAAYRSAG